MTISYRLPVLSLAATAVALTGLAAGTTGFGARIDRSYSEAFDRLGGSPQSDRSASSSLAQGSASPTSRGIAGDAHGLNPAHIRLSRLPVSGEPRPAFAVGDRMTLATSDGGTRTFDVVEVRPLAGAETGVGSDALAASPAATLFMVTAVSTGDDRRTRKVRFIVDADGSPDVMPLKDAPARPHAL